jgi:hypothetical protein
MYLVNTKPDICFAVNTLSQFMVEPRRVHWVAEKHVLRYLCGTVDYGLDYQRGDEVRLVGYTNSDWEGCVSDRKNTSGCCFGLGSTVVSWFSQKQKSVALIFAEDEYMAASQASCEALWLRDPGGYQWPPTFSDWLKTVFWQFWQFTIFSRF